MSDATQGPILRAVRKDFSEEDHPRDDHGRFGSGGGGNAKGGGKEGGGAASHADRAKAVRAHAETVMREIHERHRDEEEAKQKHVDGVQQKLKDAQVASARSAHLVQVTARTHSQLTESKYAHELTGQDRHEAYHKEFDRRVRSSMDRYDRRNNSFPPHQVTKGDSTYAQDFRDKARALLEPEAYDRIHLAARGAAGGRKSRPKPRSMQQMQSVTFDKDHYDAQAAQEWADANGLPPGKWEDDPSAPYHEKIMQGALSGEVHVPVPLARGVTAKYAGRKGKMARPRPVMEQATKLWRKILRADDEVEAVGKGYDDGPPPQDPSPNLPPQPLTSEALEYELLMAGLSPDLATARAAQRLVAGMDHHLQSPGVTAEAARAKASANLAQFITTYDAVTAGAEGETAHLDGLDLDLCCGPDRAHGALGLDTYAYDHGVILHDVTLGIPFGDNSARNVWMARPADWDPAQTGDVLAESRRVLMPGGRLHLAGEDGFASAALGMPGFEPLPDYVSGGTSDWQHYARVDIAAPALHGAGEEWSVVDDWLPAGAQAALLAERSVPAETAMANLINKKGDDPPPLYVRKTIPIVKADAAKKLVYGVVLAPHEIDTQNDYMEPDEIERAAHKYMTSSRVVGSEHGGAIEATPVESFIAPVDMKLEGPHGEQQVTRGSWVLGVKIHDDDIWDKVQSGEYTGFSVGGFGLRDPGEASSLHVTLADPT